MRRALCTDALCPHRSDVESASDCRNINIQNNSTIARKSYNNLATQTKDLNSTHTPLNQHIMANVNTEETHAIPIILVKIKELTVPFLIDTGSSISIINRSHFENVKHMLHPKYLSRKVHISTVNSTVQFHAYV